jgi:alkanesulfonate monooxygenase SsuD/methylene tetrahydromethanopterin reductase-like flavin-dependent oxidoreductase (luciferase family)/predicted kinase
VLRLPAPCLVVLVGPGASGKSTWAAAHFAPGSVVSSDRLRAVVGAGEDDVTASADALRLLDEIVALRVGRGLTTVVDTLGLDAGRRAAWRELARAAGVPCVAVAFDTPAGECRERNRSRTKRIPADVLAGQLRAWPAVREALRSEGFADVIAPEPVRVVAAPFATSSTGPSSTPGTRPGSRPAPPVHAAVPPAGLRFGLHLSQFAAPGGAPAMRGWLREVATSAESAGFDAVYVMDHFRQIPQVGRPFDDMLESFTTLAYLAACTERVRLGALVAAVTHRSVPLMAKTVATLDVLSGGRAVCGLGLGWFAAEQAALGIALPPVADRYALLEDALRLLPVMWGPGSKPFHGRVLDVPEALCYPRPLQEHVPILVGGAGERRTLRLAAELADAANVFGDLDTVRRKAAVLRDHCADVGRDPDQVALTHLTTALVGDDDGHVARLVETHRPRRRSAESYAATVHAGTVDDHVQRFGALADAGVAEVMVRLVDVGDPESVARMGLVIAALRQP